MGVDGHKMSVLQTIHRTHCQVRGADLACTFEAYAPNFTPSIRLTMGLSV